MILRVTFKYSRVLILPAKYKDSRILTLSFYNYEHPKKDLPILLSRLARDS